MPRPAMVWGGTLVMSVALEDEAAAGRLVDAADEVEDRALAGAVGADDGEDLALLHVEGDAVHGADAAERDRDVPRLEQRPPRPLARAGDDRAPIGFDHAHRTRSVLR